MGLTVKQLKDFLNCMDDEDKISINDGEFDYDVAVMNIGYNRLMGGQYLNISLDMSDKKELEG